MFAADVEDRIAKVEAVIGTARDRWSGFSVSLNSFIGGQDPKAILSAIASIEKNEKQWEAAGRAYVANPPSQEKVDKWVTWGNEMLRQLAGIGDDAATSEIGRVLVDTAKASASDVADGAVAIAFGIREWYKVGIAVLLLIGVAYVYFRVKKG